MRIRRSLFPAVLLAALCVAPLAAQGTRVAVRVLDAESARPLEGAVVRFRGTALERRSDAAGKAFFDTVPHGAYLLELEHPQRGTFSREVAIRGDRGMEIELRVPRQYGVEPLVVKARSARERETRARGTRRDLFTRAEIAEVETAKRNVGELLRGQIPGLSVYEAVLPDESGMGIASRRVCIQLARRMHTLGGGTRNRSRCAMVSVYVDGLRINDPGSYLLRLGLHDLESVEVLGPVVAGARYGTDAGNGVLEIYTRGNGPNAQRGGS